MNTVTVILLAGKILAVFSDKSDAAQFVKDAGPLAEITCDIQEWLVR